MKKNVRNTKHTNLMTQAKMKAIGLSTAVMAGLPAIASADADWSDGNTVDAGNLVLSVAEIVVNIFPFIGIFFVLAGVFKLILAYRNGQPEEQTTAAKDIVIGAVFLAFRLFVWGTLKTAITGA